MYDNPREVDAVRWAGNGFQEADSVRTWVTKEPNTVTALYAICSVEHVRWSVGHSIVADRDRAGEGKEGWNAKGKDKANLSVTANR